MFYSNVQCLCSYCYSLRTKSERPKVVEVFSERGKKAQEVLKLSGVKNK